jgi:AraC-like DNA-binding protein
VLCDEAVYQGRHTGDVAPLPEANDRVQGERDPRRSGSHGVAEGVGLDRQALGPVEVPDEIRTHTPPEPAAPTVIRLERKLAVADPLGPIEELRGKCKALFLLRSRVQYLATARESNCQGGRIIQPSRPGDGGAAQDVAPLPFVVGRDLLRQVRVDAHREGVAAPAERRARLLEQRQPLGVRVRCIRAAHRKRSLRQEDPRAETACVLGGSADRPPRLLDVSRSQRGAGQPYVPLDPLPVWPVSSHPALLALAQPPRAPTPLAVWATLWREADRMAADPALGLKVGQVAPIDPTLITGYTFRAAHSLADFARHHLELQRITFHADMLFLREVGKTVELRFADATGYATSRHAVEYTCVALVRSFRAFFGAVPYAITFRHPVPPNPVEHARILGVPVHFAVAENAIVLTTSAFERSRPLYSEATFDRLCRAAEEVLRELTMHLFRDRVCTVLRQRMRARRSVSMEAVSDVLHVSRRSLQRRLAEEGTSFRQLLDWVRHEAALTRLRDGDGVTQIARATGFVEIASFCRAFRRWTGTTVAGFREREQGLRRSA